MEPYIRTTMNQEALDFRSCPKREKNPEKMIEAPILDLSCKKQVVTISNSNEPTESCETRLQEFSPIQESQRFNDSGQRSPFEGRTFMVTPPSESESPKKSKYESIYNSPIAAQQGNLPILPVNIPPISGVLSNLLLQNSNQVQLPTTSNPTLSGEGMISISPDKKPARPFKAYPKDPLSLTTELIYDQNSNEAYSEFRKRMLESVRKTNEGTNAKMRRVTKSPSLPTSTVDEKDAAYWERRRKNNEAAKRSRDARRAKEDEIAIRAAFLEQENMKLKYELVALRNETAKLRCMVFSN